MEIDNLVTCPIDEWGVSSDYATGDRIPGRDGRPHGGGAGARARFAAGSRTGATGKLPQEGGRSSGEVDFMQRATVENNLVLQGIVAVREHIGTVRCCQRRVLDGAAQSGAAKSQGAGADGAKAKAGTVCHRPSRIARVGQAD